MNRIATVSASALRLAASVCADGEPRHFLRGVNLEPRQEGGAYLIGSNGHICVVIVDAKAILADPTKALVVSVPKDVCKALPRRHQHDHAAPSSCDLFAGTDKNVTFTLNRPESVLPGRGKLIDTAQLISWRRLVPQPGKALAPVNSYLNAHLMRGVLKGLATEFNAFHLSCQSDEGLHYMHLPRHPDVFVALMPMRDDGDVKKRDLWLSAFQHEAQSKAWVKPEPEMMAQDPDHPEDEPVTAETAEA